MVDLETLLLDYKRIACNPMSCIIKEWYIKEAIDATSAFRSQSKSYERYYTLLSKRTASSNKAQIVLIPDISLLIGLQRLLSLQL